jgi:Flp pilus assembly protein TadG
MLFQQLRQSLFDFCSAQSGNVALTFGIAIIPIMCGVGAAVDYSRANDVKVKLQSAVDSTALMLSKEAATDTSSQLQSNASKYFLAMFNPSGVQNVSLTATYSSTGGTNIVVNGSALVPTTFMQIFGVNTMEVGSSSTVRWGSTRLRVAMVLDNTGSMQQSGKMNALKTAANNFLSQMKSAAANNGDVYVSIIPFSTSVNVGASNYTQSWLAWTEYGKCNGGWGGWGGGNYTQALCKASGGNWSAYPASKQQYWTGCVIDRGGTTGPTGSNYDTNVSMPNIGDPAILFPAVDYSACPQEAMGLGYDWSAMSTLINNMSPNGYTNQNIGLELGWMSLAGGGPFTVPPTDPNVTYKNSIILFTDGLNTEDRWYTDQPSIDARQTMTCNNAKAAGITLYTVQISTDGTAPSSLLRNCASDSTKYFYLTSSSQLVTTFNQIGTDISDLRIAN